MITTWLIFTAVGHDICMIRCIYILSITPLRIYLGRGLLERYLKCFFLAVFAEFVLAKDFRLCEKQ